MWVCDCLYGGVCGGNGCGGVAVFSDPVIRTFEGGGAAVRCERW